METPPLKTVFNLTFKDLERIIHSQVDLLLRSNRKPKEIILHSSLKGILENNFRQTTTISTNFTVQLTHYMGCKVEYVDDLTILGCVGIIFPVIVTSR